MYKVIVRFKDLQDGGYLYRAGDEFPRLGASVSDERIAELMSEKNAIGRPLIEGEAVKKTTRKKKG